MKAIVTSASYAVPLSRKQLDALNKRSYLDEVYPKLMSAGADGQSIDFGGLAGMYIYFTLDDVRNLDRIIRVVEELCE